MLDLFVQVWDQLPVCAVIDEKVLVVHGGLFRLPDATLEHLEMTPRKDCDTLCDPAKDPAMALLVDALWSDPQTEPGQSFGERGDGTTTFGPDITENFLTRNGLILVIRSHQVRNVHRLEPSV